MYKNSHILVLNEAKTTNNIQSVICNLLPKMVRLDSMEEREFWVVPMVILTEGVHKGSEGPLYYPPSELGKTPAAWNHKPIVVYHPEMNGQAVSACDPSIITNRKVGIMMNTKYEKGRLKSEAWIEKDRANKVDERIMAAIEASEMMEVSTGVFVDSEATDGEWNGEEYIGIARNYRPDHLAILPDKVGACSIKDGAGFLRNEKGVQSAGILAKLKQWLTQNEMSHSNIANNLSGALRKKLNVTDNGPYCWVTDVYNDFFVYEMDNKLYRLGYSATDTGVTLNDDKPVEVKRVTEYRTVEGAFVGNQDQTKQENNMDKKKLVDSIVGNAAAGWSEADRAGLMAMSEDQLKRIVGNVIAPVPASTTTTPAPAAAAPQAAPAPVAASAANAQPAPAPEPAKQPQTVDDYIKAAPPQVREVLNNSLSAYNAEKDKLVEAILANKNHTFTKEDLSSKPLGELKNLAALAGIASRNAEVRTVNYAGQGSVPTGNEAEEPLEMPTINFSKQPVAAAK